jgi:hypothetical protein
VAGNEDAKELKLSYIHALAEKEAIFLSYVPVSCSSEQQAIIWMQFKGPVLVQAVVLFVDQNETPHATSGDVTLSWTGSPWRALQRIICE